MQITSVSPALAARRRAAPPRPPGGEWRWLLVRAWCLLLGAWLGQGLRSALRGCPPAAAAGPPIRPRRPKRPGRVHGHSPLPYPSAA